MPHLIIECSENIAPALRKASAVKLCHDVMLESGLFALAAVKTRLHGTSDYSVGEQQANGAFCHALVYLMQGRTHEQKKALSNALFTALDTLVPEGASLTIDIRELDAGMYRKRS